MEGLHLFLCCEFLFYTKSTLHSLAVYCMHKKVCTIRCNKLLIRKKVCKFVLMFYFGCRENKHTGGTEASSLSHRQQISWIKSELRMKSEFIITMFRVMYNTKIQFLVLFRSRKSEGTCCQLKSGQEESTRQAAQRNSSQ